MHTFYIQWTVRNAVSSCLLLLLLNGSLGEPLWIFHKLWHFFLAFNWQLCDTGVRAEQQHLCVICQLHPRRSCELLSLITAGGNGTFSLQELFSKRAHTNTHTDTHTYTHVMHTSGPFQSLLLFHYQHHQVLQMWTLLHCTENNGPPVLCLELMTSYHCCSGNLGAVKQVILCITHCNGLARLIDTMRVLWASVGIVKYRTRL